VAYERVGFIDLANEPRPGGLGTRPAPTSRSGAVLRVLGRYFWLKHREAEFEDVKRMSRVDEGFIGTLEARFVEPNPDNRYDFLEGLQRLQALEEALATERRKWDDDRAQRASDWLRQPGSAELLITDFEKVGARVGDFPTVLNDFGWAHRPPEEGKSGPDISTTATQDTQ